MNRLARIFLVCFVVVMAGLPSLAPAAIANPESGTQKLLIAKTATTALEQAQRDGKLLVDYGGFSLWQVPTTSANRLLADQGVQFDPDFDTIFLRDGAFNPLEKARPQPAELAQVRTDAPQFWMVQFVGPVTDAWLEEIQILGAKPVIAMPSHAFVVWADGAAIERLEKRVAESSFIQWTGPYHPAYRLAPYLRTNTAADSMVTVQLYTPAGIDADLAELKKIGGRFRRGPSRVLDFTNVTVSVPTHMLPELARTASVFNIEPWSAPQLLDERQAQVLAGNFTTVNGKTVPTGPGYLQWLANSGFPTDPYQYPVIDVVDDGLDIGDVNNVQHPDFYTFGDPTQLVRVSYIENCTLTDAGGNAIGGHGNLNAGIVAGYNNRSGAPYTDGASDQVPAGSHVGLGISPYGRVASTKIFAFDGSYDIGACGTSDHDAVEASYQSGAAITSNSWGCDGGPCAGAAYDASSQAYDALTHDASALTAGQQPMLHIFSAGNSGGGGIANTIGTPGTAKNVLTVGATENVRDQGVLDGCQEPHADNADEIASFSSRGPTSDGRTKPDIMAPGTHVMGPASQDPAFDGTGVCGASNNKFYPTNQTMYTWSSGTSHSAPAVAGGASLLHTYYRLTAGGGAAPSPAMLKAYLLNSTRYLAPIGGNLPTNHQGYGDLHLAPAVDSTPKMFLDQKTTFAATGETTVVQGVIADSSKPFRVTLAWSDAPGSTTGDAYVNNLDLTVTVGGQTYRGNVFDGATSTTGGSADTKNNVESVMLPVGVSGPFQITVTAANIAGDGVPGNADATDQNFALAVYNGASGPTGTLSGHVRLSTNAPLAAASVSTNAGQGDLTDPSGAYTIQLPAGTYTITAAPGSLNPQTTTVNITAGSTTTQNFTFSAGSITGIVRDSFTPSQPIAGAVVSNGLTSVGTAEDGAFTFPMVSAGQQTLNTTKPSYQSSTVNLTVTDNTTATATITLNAGAVTGVVREQGSNQPIAQAVVELGSQTLTTDAGGNFALRQPPGSYTLKVSKPGYATVNDPILLTNGVTTTRDLNLMASLMVTPQALSQTLPFGSPPFTQTQGLTLTNNTTEVLTVTVRELGDNPDLSVLLVDREATEAATAAEQALEKNGYSVTHINNIQFETMPLATLQQYKAVFYAGNTGTLSTSPSTLKLMEYLDAGGRLFIADNDLGYWNQGFSFYKTHLDSTYGGDDPGAGNFALTGENIMAGVSADSADFTPDYYLPKSNSTVIFRYADGSVAGSRIARNNYRVVYIATDFDLIGTEATNEPVEAAIAGKGMAWLLGGDPDVLPWLDESPKVVPIAAGSNAAINVGWFPAEFNQPGLYNGALEVAYTTDPDLARTIPVTLNVVPLPEQFQIMGRVEGITACTTTPLPLEDVTVTITNTNQYQASTSTHADGSYRWYLPSAGEYMVTFSAAGYASQHFSFTGSAGGTVSQNAILIQPAACFNSTASLTSTQQSDTVITQTLNLSNPGSLPVTWQAQEGVAQNIAAAPATETRTQPAVIQHHTRQAAAVGVGIQDGGFETTTNALNSHWSQDSTEFGTVLCSHSLCGPTPRTGTWYAWFGGVAEDHPVDEHAYIEQTALITGNVKTLDFWLRIGSATARPNDLMRVKIDDTTVFTITNYEMDGYETYTRVSVPIDQFADNRSHVIRFEGLIEAGGNTNFFIDDISMNAQPVSCGANTLAWVSVNPSSGTIPAGGSTNATVTFDSTGLAPGHYNGFVCFQTNASLLPVQYVRVSLQIPGTALFLPFVKK